MKLFDLGTIPWKDTQLIYHTLASKNIEALILHSCYETYVCLGLPHNPNDELDLDFCKTNNIPIFRREIGGGTVLLDRNQIFFHLIINRKHPLVPYGQIPFFKRFLKPIIETYQELGIAVEYRPINDLVVGGRKISGTGGGEIEESRVLGSSILLDFDYDLMSKVLKAPNEIFREKILESMKRNLTTVKKELGYLPSRAKIKDLIISNYKEILGDFEYGKITKELTAAKKDVEKRMMNENWLFQRGMKRERREVKIIEGINVTYHEYDNNNRRIGLILETIDDKIAGVSLTENGTKIINKKIEENLIDEKFEEKKIIDTIVEYS